MRAQICSHGIFYVTQQISETPVIKSRGSKPHPLIAQLVMSIRPDDHRTRIFIAVCRKPRPYRIWYESHGREDCELTWQPRIKQINRVVNTVTAVNLEPEGRIADKRASLTDTTSTGVDIVLCSP